MTDFECRITRSCIYWDPEKRDIKDFMIEAETLEEACKLLNKEAWKLEIRSGASKLVQDVMIKIGGEWTPISEILTPYVKPQRRYPNIRQDIFITTVLLLIFTAYYLLIPLPLFIIGLIVAPVITGFGFLIVWTYEKLADQPLEDLHDN